MASWDKENRPNSANFGGLGAMNEYRDSSKKAYMEEDMAINPNYIEQNSLYKAASKEAPPVSTIVAEILGSSMESKSSEHQRSRVL